MTLIQCGNSDSTRRCDAKCYQATGPECDCVCGGINHGRGRECAIDNTRALAGELLRAVEARGGVIAPELRQGLLV